MNDGDAIQDGYESYARPGRSSSSPEPSTQMHTVRLGPGILIFSRGRQMPYMNCRALELISHSNQAKMGSVNDLHLALVREFSVQIQETMDSRREANIRGLFELKRVIGDAGRKILVRGFGLAGRNPHDDSRIVIVLKEFDLPEKHLNGTDLGLTL